MPSAAGACLLNGCSITDGVDGAVGAKHAQVLVCYYAAEVCLCSLRQPRLHCHRNPDLTLLTHYRGLLCTSQSAGLAT